MLIEWGKSDRAFVQKSINRLTSVQPHTWIEIQPVPDEQATFWSMYDQITGKMIYVTGRAQKNKNCRVDATERLYLMPFLILASYTVTPNTAGMYIQLSWFVYRNLNWIAAVKQLPRIQIYFVFFICLVENKKRCKKRITDNTWNTIIPFYFITVPQKTHNKKRIATVYFFLTVLLLKGSSVSNKIVKAPGESTITATKGKQFATKL